jgi:hypothetical protein
MRHKIVQHQAGQSLPINLDPCDGFPQRCLLLSHCCLHCNTAQLADHVQNCLNMPSFHALGQNLHSHGTSVCTSTLVPWQAVGQLIKVIKFSVGQAVIAASHTQHMHIAEPFQSDGTEGFPSPISKRRHKSKNLEQAACHSHSARAPSRRPGKQVPQYQMSSWIAQKGAAS